MAMGPSRRTWATAVLIAITIALPLPSSAQVFYEIAAPDGSRDWLLGTQRRHQFVIPTDEVIG